jgi:hypothetical protein
MSTKSTNGPDPSAGGNARAKKLSKTQRTEIARTAADARWNVLRATHAGELDLAGHKISCAVLEDGRRVLNQQTFLAAIGRRGNPKDMKATGDGGDFFKTPAFLAADNLKPFIGETLAGSCSPVIYRLPVGGRGYGYEARLLPLVCEVYLAARRANVLTHNQSHVAEACEVLVSALAQVGIVALVDEATGYQEIRDRRALQAILDQYLRQAFAAWAKRFPDEFYQEMFRLRGWTWKGMQVNRPQCVAAYTKDLIYCRLAPGIVQELEERNPVQLNGRRKAAHHQWLTEDLGHPALSQHLHAVIALMRASPSRGWNQFMQMMDRALPKRGHSIQLTFDDLELDCDPVCDSSTEPQPPSEQSPPAAPV